MLQTDFGPMDGDKWEQICKICFHRMYEDEIYTHIEASPGDDGIEGFTDSGKAFQCYCPDFSYSASELHINLTIKVNDDLKKLKNKEKELKKHLGNTKIKTWYLVTPEIRKKEIIAYCNKKTDEVKGWGLVILDNENFKVTVVDIAFIKPFIPLAILGLSEKTIYSPAETTADDIKRYSKDNDNGYLVENAQTKHTKQLEQGGANTSASDNLTHNTIKHYLQGKKTLELWKQQQPKEFEKFEKLISHEEEDIERQCLFPSENHNQLYNNVKEKLEELLMTNFSYIDNSTIKDLSKYVIADWILRCPLNFV